VPRARGTLTFTKDIAPIVLGNCAVCHRPGQSAPFSLLTYEDVKERAQQIQAVTASRFMPPWLPESEPGEFVGQRKLSVDQLGVIGQWIDEGAAEGDPTQMPALPNWAAGWYLGEPDLVVTMDQPYTLPNEGQDVFRNFVIPIPVRGQKYVKGLEFRPGNPRVAHHARMAVDSTDVSRYLDQQDREPGFDGMQLGEAKSPDGHFLGWTPGKFPTMAPDGMAWRLNAEMDFVIQLHMLPTGKPETVQPTIGLFFSDQPPTRTPLMLRLGSKVIDIPAGKKDYIIRDSYRLPVDVQLLSVYPHAHYLCKEMYAEAQLPSGDKKRIVHIKDWDFNWQDDYRYAEPIDLPKGTLIAMQYVYDNSSDNVRNPHTPPQHVIYGPQSSDEMGDLWMQVVPLKAHQMATLQQDFGRKDLLARIDGYKFRLKHDPNDFVAHNSLGLRLLSLGRSEEAVEHFHEAIRINPRYSKGHNNLGFFYQQKGKVYLALRHYEEAVRLEPDNYKAQNNLANALLSTQRFEDAIKHYREALRINPDYAKAHANLAATLKMLGRTDEAQVHAQQAKRLGAG
jgi:tetratricopeptide (TPR) repeat protein